MKRNTNRNHIRLLMHHVFTHYDTILDMEHNEIQIRAVQVGILEDKWEYEIWHDSVNHPNMVGALKSKTMNT